MSIVSTEARTIKANPASEYLIDLKNESRPRSPRTDNRRAGMALFLDYQSRRHFDIALFAVAAVAVGGGLIITRLVETYGKPLPVPGVGDEWNAAASTGTTNTWQPDRPDTWEQTQTTPASRTDRWDDGPWGTTRS